ncbi:OmpA family protein [Pseudopelagicola sp. nBUS_19]|uniref:OmpA family protein n=2 Tax=unclassified Pseudopelagicola TaxID=2649563 RepID=UPI003EBF99DC
MMRSLAICLAILPETGWAFEPVLPDGAQLMSEFAKDDDYYAVPMAPFLNGVVETDRLRGAVRRRSWRIETGFSDTRKLDVELTAQMLDKGYDIALACDAELCGGFDFRFQTEVLPPPEMFVDLSDFYFISGFREGEAGREGVGVLVSRTAQAGMVQVIHVSEESVRFAVPNIDGVQPQLKGRLPLAGNSPNIAELNLRPAVVDADSISLWLEKRGHIVLSDLVFDTGSSRLGQGPFLSLMSLAAFLKEDETRRIALVGHTDSEGTLTQNTELSEKRAVSVRKRLIEIYNVRQDQLEAQGVGFLSPIASNLKEEGRSANRRVEAVLLNTR